MSILSNNQEWINETWKKIDKKMQKVAVRSRDKIPYTADENGIHDDRRSTNISLWTNGFWGGLMWLMYIGSKNDVYKTTALNAEKIMDEAFKNYDMLNHDVGFMWHIMSGVNYRITGDKEARLRNIYAANLLASRYDTEGGYIIAWDSDGNRYASIIDCMMNIPLLHWASEETSRDTYKAIAIAHADMTMRDHIRHDGSVIHIIHHNNDTGEANELSGGQGYKKGSCWSRGQAWALYGFALSYIHTGKQEYLDTAKKVANYFIAASCNDWLPKSDFRSPKEPVLYDMTAACCAACGLIEIANNVSEYEKETYLSAAINILKACDAKFCNYDEDIDYIVGGGTLMYPNVEFREVHIPIIYGDYYFVEALLKLRGNDFIPW